MTCQIIPDYVLRRLAGSDDTDLARDARRTLDLDQRRRRTRAEGLLQSTTRRRRRSKTAALPAPAPSRQVYDAQNGSDLPGVLVRDEGAEPTGDAAVDEAYDALGHTWQLFWQGFGRDSLDGKGMGLVASVHFGVNYDNAFWDGSQMVFGDGDQQVFLGFTRSIDVIGHELTHAVTQYTAGLNYADQSGALNESISDVFGSLVKQRVLGHNAAEADWLIGADILAPSVQGVALRSMKEPGTAYDDPLLGKDPQPGHMRDYVETDDDNGGVHINSGIPNKAFYLVATTLGGPAWQVPGQIWYDTINGDIKADCDFVTFAELTHAAALTRYGAESREAAAVAQAWVDVGVIPADAGEPSAAAQSTEAGEDAAGSGQPAPTNESTLTVRRSGGFAGLVRERQVILADLPARDRRAWGSLLVDPGLHELAVTTSHPDAFRYGIQCDHPAIDVEIPEPALPRTTRHLIERTLRVD